MIVRARKQKPTQLRSSIDARIENLIYETYGPVWFRKTSYEDLIWFLNKQEMPDRSKAILIKYYLERTVLQDLASEYDLSRERIRQIIAQAKRFLRWPPVLWVAVEFFQLKRYDPKCTGRVFDKFRVGKF